MRGEERAGMRGDPWGAAAGAGTAGFAKTSFRKKVFVHSLHSKKVSLHNLHSKKTANRTFRGGEGGAGDLAVLLRDLPVDVLLVAERLGALARARGGRLLLVRSACRRLLREPHVPVPARGTRRVRLVRGEGRGVST